MSSFGVCGVVLLVSSRPHDGVVALSPFFFGDAADIGTTHQRNRLSGCVMGKVQKAAV